MIENFVNSIRNIFTIPDLRKRVLFTLAMLAIYRIGSHVRTPGIDPLVLSKLWDQGVMHRSLAGVMDLFSGGNFRVVSIFALGITPYITASIILQLMTVVSARLKACRVSGTAATSRSRGLDPQVFRSKTDRHAPRRLNGRSKDLSRWVKKLKQ